MRSRWKNLIVSKNLKPIFKKLSFISNRDNFSASLNDLILPLYLNKVFSLNRGNYFESIKIDRLKIGSKFSDYVYTKKFSPIHKGTSFTFTPTYTRNSRSKLFFGKKKTKNKKTKFFHMKKFEKKSSSKSKKKD